MTDALNPRLIRELHGRFEEQYPFTPDDMLDAEIRGERRGYERAVADLKLPPAGVMLVLTIYGLIAGLCGVSIGYILGAAR